jgi:hypothetical protein
MPRMPAAFRHTARTVDFSELQLTFLVSAVATILVIRTQLWLTNYPQLGGHGLHIAHLLWGGVFMVLAIGLLITLAGRGPRRPAAIVGGVGFGFFIDELGKFITSDNNYFFAPAAAIIYLIFVGLFMAIRAMRERGALRPEERLVNVLELVADSVRRPLRENEKLQALTLLDGLSAQDPLVTPVRGLIERADAIPQKPASRTARWAEAGRVRYRSLCESSRFRAVIAVLFALWAAVTLLATVGLVLAIGIAGGSAEAGFRSDAISQLHFVNVASLVSSAVSAIFVVVAVVQLRRRHRLSAYRWLERALLVAIFVTSVFSFVESQFGAVFDLAIDLVLLVTVRSMIELERREENASDPHRPATPTAAAPVSA